MARQVDTAQRMYSARAADYEKSWHPDYSRRFMALIDIRPGMQVLDLCCGTGLEAFLAADIVGDDGKVVGVDATEGMIVEMRARMGREPELGARITVLRHDVTDLETLEEVKGKTFDIIICSNAFVLFDEPAAVLRQWKKYLKPEGVLAVDAPHEFNLRSGIVMERVAKRMGVYSPSNRAWITSRDSFKQMLESEGYVVVKMDELTKVTGNRKTYYTAEQADEQFDYLVNTVLSEIILTDDEAKERARPIFREEFAKDAIDGKIEIVDSLYVYVAKRG